MAASRKIEVQLVGDASDLERSLAGALVALKAFGAAADDTGKRNDKLNQSNQSLTRSTVGLLQSMKPLIPVVASAGIAVLAFTGNLTALIPIAPILTAALAALITPFADLAAIAVAFVGPLSTVAVLLGGLAGAFFLGAQRALTAKHGFDQFQDSVNNLKRQFLELTTTLAHDFMPYFERLANAARIALNYFNQLAKMPLAEAMHSVTTRGLAMLNRFVYDVANVLNKPFRLAIRLAFGNNGADGALAKWVNSLQGFLFGHTENVRVGVHRGAARGAALVAKQIPGALEPIKKWFDRQDFTKTGHRWGNELAKGIIAALSVAISNVVSNIWRGKWAGALVSWSALFHAVWGKISSFLSSAWSGIERDATKSFSDTWASFKRLAQSAWDFIKGLFKQVLTVHISVPGSGALSSLYNNTVGRLVPHTGGIVGIGSLATAATGGIVYGGIQGVDSVPALLTPGEVVLNRGQQMRLLTGGVGSGFNGTVQVYLGGDQLEPYMMKVVDERNRQVSMRERGRRRY